MTIVRNNCRVGLASCLDGGGTCNLISRRRAAAGGISAIQLMSCRNAVQLAKSGLQDSLGNGRRAQRCHLRHYNLSHGLLAATLRLCVSYLLLGTDW